MGALLLQAFYPIRSERQFVERIDDDLLFRWFSRAYRTRCATRRLSLRNRDRPLGGVPKIRALLENTFFVGLRKAGLPEE
jgi:hypothetical protein